MLNYDELEEVLEHITAKVTLANRSGNLDELFAAWGFDDLIQQSSSYDTEKNGKIVVIGETEVKENILLGIAKGLGIEKDRFEFCLDYGKAKTYPYSKLRYDPKYRVVVFGPVPHSSTGKNDSSSVIAEMKNHEGYPRVEVLSSNNAVKITKSKFKQTMEMLIAADYI